MYFILEKMAMDDVLDSPATVYKEQDTQEGQGLPT